MCECEGVFTARAHWRHNVRYTLSLCPNGLEIPSCCSIDVWPMPMADPSRAQGYDTATGRPAIRIGHRYLSRPRPQGWLPIYNPSISATPRSHPILLPLPLPPLPIPRPLLLSLAAPPPTTLLSLGCLQDWTLRDEYRTRSLHLPKKDVV